MFVIKCCLPVFLLPGFLLGAEASSVEGTNPEIHFQAHRGGLKEVPEHTMETYIRAWDLGGIPEADIRTTRDGFIICLHDRTLARTTNAPENIREVNVSNLKLEQIQGVDAGIRFGPVFRGQGIPTLASVFEEMKSFPERELYLDLKEVDLADLGGLIAEYGVGNRIVFAHNSRESLREFSAIVPNVRTMLWIGGTPSGIKQKFKVLVEDSFRGLSQVQLHLGSPKAASDVRYLLDDGYLEYALKQAAEAGVDLEVLPFEFDDNSLFRLLDLGIRWYATDYPQRFSETVRRWRD